eukprot:jgi/Chrzof1/8074/UNPLg00119.t1
MNIQLVETFEEDSYIAVAQHVANLLNRDQPKTALAETPGSKFLADCENLAHENKVDELVHRFAAQVDTIYSRCSDKDAEACLSVIIHLVPRVDTDRVSSVARKLASAIADKPEAHGDAKLSALLTLYAACPTPQSKYMVLLAAIEFAKTHKSLATAIMPAVKGKAEDWQRQWNLSDPIARDLFLALASLMKVVGDRASIKEYLKLLTSAMAIINANDAADLTRVKPMAIQAIQEFIRSPDIFQCDFWELPAVQQLSKDPQHAPLLQLLELMLAGDLAGFRSVLGSSPAEVLDSIGVNQDAAIDKVRLMSLLVLGSKASGTPVSFQEIQQALDIPENQIQPWVIRAIGHKLLEGKIDQVAQSVTITRCHNRTFSSKEWQGLGQQLRSWKEALGGMSAMISKDGSGHAAKLQAIHA